MMERNGNVGLRATKNSVIKGSVEQEKYRLGMKKELPNSWIYRTGQQFPKGESRSPVISII